MIKYVFVLLNTDVSITIEADGVSMAWDKLLCRLRAAEDLGIYFPISEDCWRVSR